MVMQPLGSVAHLPYGGTVRTEADCLAAHAEGARAGIEAAAEHHERKAAFLRESCPKQETLTHELEMAERAEEHDREALMIRALPLPQPSADALAAVEARVREEEREACAKIADEARRAAQDWISHADSYSGPESSERRLQVAKRDAAADIANAIRSRQEPGHE